MVTSDKFLKDIVERAQTAQARTTEERCAQAKLVWNASAMKSGEIFGGFVENFCLSVVLDAMEVHV